MSTLQTQDFSVDQSLRTAIQNRRVVRLRSGNKDRILEPHDYGIKNGRVRLLAYQLSGSSNGPLPNWRWIDVDSISDLQILNRTFPGGRPAPSGEHNSWDRLFIRVKPAEPHRKA